MKRAIITGPTGSIGTALIKELCRQKISIIAVCRPGSNRLAQIPQHHLVKIVECEISSLSMLPQYVEGADWFYHLAWANTFGAGRNNMPSQVANIQYTLDAVQAAAALGCEVFIGAGSQAEYGRVEGLLRADTPTFPETGYGMAKLCAGQMSRVAAQDLGIRHIWTRILSIYGPGDGNYTLVSSVLRALLNGEEPACTAGEQLWDYLYCGDAARALLLMAQKGTDGAVYPLGSGQARPLREYILAMRDAVNPDLRVGLGKRPYPPGQVMHLCADLTQLTADTGFEPEVPFSEGIKKTIDWMRTARNG